MSSPKKYDGRTKSMQGTKAKELSRWREKASTLTPLEEDLAQRIFNKFKDRYLELTKDSNIGRPSANVDEIIKVFERDLGGDLTYSYEVLPRHILEKMGFRVSLLMQDFLVSNKVNWAVLLEEHMLAVLTYHLAWNQIDLSGTKERLEKSGERTFHNCSFLSDDQRVRAARAELKLVPVALSQKPQGLQFIHRQSIDQDIDSLVQFWLTYEKVHEGNGVWVHNRDTKRVGLVWDSHASNYLFLEKLFARETLQRARIPLLQIGLNNVDTEGIASKKGRELSVLLRNSTKGNAALLHRAGEKAITEEIIREMIANALQQSSDML
ncbi:hypothetical protein L207DRAFT_590591 [Hyaloscypha variabilis F]|uniref:Uncharacterized protein n=1 Tax=Hyaloscypha variabilis (strain UAMH 11265 / GT02V1 / F) TaxID=1149755 RepID=A0A2J6R1A3_HYAVF|nr:hypothetical protein L207DRAFT_590591 [Hyaloscypha variabilis F]